MMVSLQRHLEQNLGTQREQRFFDHTFSYLSASSRRQIRPEKWMITDFEVEVLEEIGSGGL
jgi:hypothetical protein